MNDDKENNPSVVLSSWFLIVSTLVHNANVEMNYIICLAHTHSEEGCLLPVGHLREGTVKVGGESLREIHLSGRQVNQRQIVIIGGHQIETDLCSAGVLWLYSPCLWWSSTIQMLLYNVDWTVMQRNFCEYSPTRWPNYSNTHIKSAKKPLMRASQPWSIMYSVIFTLYILYIDSFISIFVTLQ